ncbi:histidine phosphatase family protein [Paraburkholderia sp. MPAMCS5]|uniref:histidine phosphatase family protein n=1 Tax=Paraburkholderia sp. MPAMCS5 TaxID=3112563 RepID=UPI002E1872EE|nr:histidine phosphatase family protein [Paraburkholderia sp. MPAMCS5]
MNLRLSLISHAPTAAMRAGRIPADDPLDARGLTDAQAARAHLPLAGDALAFVSPALCARDTASALGFTATVEPGLADLDYGAWRGLRLADLAADMPDELSAWTRDPEAAPHGGESFGQLVKRIGEWLDALNVAPGHATNHTRDIVAVTHAPVMRAAIVHVLGASPAIYSRIEIAPLAVVTLQRSQRRGWTWQPSSR